MDHETRSTINDLMFAFWIVISICTTAFPILYGITSKWYNSKLGRAIMIWSLAFAIHVDVLSILLRYSSPYTDLYLWTRTVVLAIVALATLYVTWTMLSMNLLSPKDDEDDDRSD